MSTVNIYLGTGGPSVGEVGLDERQIKGVGGWQNPALHIPINIHLYPTQAGEQIALAHLCATLYLTETQAVHQQFGPSINYNVVNNLHIISPIGTKPSDGGLQLLFPLTYSQIKQLDDLRHKEGSNLYLYLDPIIVWIDPLEYAHVTLGQREVSLGQRSAPKYSWSASIGMLRIDLAEIKWAKNVFPGLGYDHYRLVEVSLPATALLVPKEAIEFFQKALKAYDAGDPPQCLRECRLVLEEIEKHLKVQNHQLGTAIAKNLGWPDHPKITDQADFLNHAWLGVYILANAASHTPSTKSLQPADVHTGLLSLAVLLEYLGQLQ